MDTPSSIQLKTRTKKIAIIAIIVVIAVGLIAGLVLVLSGAVSVMVVESSSMSINYNTQGPPYPLEYFLLTLMHPFDRTLNVGDVIVIQAVDPKTLNTNYPNSDVIVYKKPTGPTDTPIVHRIAASYEVNGALYFQTKGDGNDTPWPAPVNPNEYDSNRGVWADGDIPWPTGQGVPADLVEGKVILRIPYFGWVTLFLQSNSWVVPLLVAVIVLLLVVEFLISLLRQKKKPSPDSA